MKNERILTNAQDLDFASNQKTSSDLSWDIGIVTEILQDDVSNSPNGIIKCKILKNFNTTSKIDKTNYRPINPNTTNIPLIGEYVLLLNTSGAGSYYVTSLNYFNSINSNVPNNLNNFIFDSESEFIQKNSIKNSNLNSFNLNEKSIQSFTPKNVQKSKTNIGDVKLEGRYGNFINLTYYSNDMPSIAITNVSSSIAFNNVVLQNTGITSTSFNEEIYPVYSTQSENTILMQSDKVIIQSRGNGGTFVESKNSIGMVSDNDVTINGSRLASIDASIITIGDGAISPVILGNEFSEQWRDFINGLHTFLDIIINGTDNSTLSLAATTFKFILDSKIASKESVLSESSSKFLSKQVFVK